MTTDALKANCLHLLSTGTHIPGQTKTEVCVEVSTLLALILRLEDAERVIEPFAEIARKRDSHRSAKVGEDEETACCRLGDCRRAEEWRQK